MKQEHHSEKKYPPTPLSTFLQMVRNSTDYNQQDVADYLGISRQTYSHYETARLTPDLRCIAKLAQFYDRPLEDFVKFAIADDIDYEEIVRLVPKKSAQRIHEPQTQYQLAADDQSARQDFFDYLHQAGKMPNQFEGSEAFYYFSRIPVPDRIQITNLLRRLYLYQKQLTHPDSDSTTSPNPET